MNMVQTKQTVRKRTDRRIRHISAHSKMMRTTRVYHNKCMRDLFVEHYDPLWNGKLNKHWTIHMEKNAMTHLRLHLSWVVGYDVFCLNDEQIGRKILKTYKKSKALPFLLKMIGDSKDLMRRYGDMEF